MFFCYDYKFINNTFVKEKRIYKINHIKNNKNYVSISRKKSPGI